MKFKILELELRSDQRSKNVMNNRATGATLSHSPFTNMTHMAKNDKKMQMCVICASHPLTNHSHLQLPRNIKSYKDQAIDEDGAGVDQQTYHLRQSFRILCSTGSITMVPKSSMDSWSHVKPHEYELKSDLKSKCHPRCQASPNATDVVVLTICTLPIYEKPGTMWDLSLRKTKGFTSPGRASGCMINL